MGHYLDIAPQTFKVLGGVPMSCPRPILECPLCNVWVSKWTNELMSYVMKYVDRISTNL